MRYVYQWKVGFGRWGVVDTAQGCWLPDLFDSPGAAERFAAALNARNA